MFGMILNISRELIHLLIEFLNPFKTYVYHHLLYAIEVWYNTLALVLQKRIVRLLTYKAK